MQYKVDWVSMRNEFLASKMSLREFSDAKGLSYNTVRQVARNYQWLALREAKDGKDNKIIAQEVVQEVIETDVVGAAERVIKINAAADKLLDKISKAIDELSLDKCRVRTTEYLMDDKGKKKTVIKETWEASEGLVDTTRMQQAADALKKLKDIILEDIMQSATEGTGVVVIPCVLDDTEVTNAEDDMETTAETD